MKEKAEPTTHKSQLTIRQLRERADEQNRARGVDDAQNEEAVGLDTHPDDLEECKQDRAHEGRGYRRRR